MAFADPQQPQPSPDTSPKPALKSKTILGALVAMMPAVLTMLGVEMEDEAAQEIGGAVVTIVGAIIAIHGRFAAKKGIIFAILAAAMLTGCAIRARLEYRDGKTAFGIESDGKSSVIFGSFGRGGAR